MQVQILLHRTAAGAVISKTAVLVDLAVVLSERGSAGELRGEGRVHGPYVADRELTQRLIEDRADRPRSD